MNFLDQTATLSFMLQDKLTTLSGKKYTLGEGGVTGLV